MTPEMVEFVRRSNRAREFEDAFLSRNSLRSLPGVSLSLPSVGRPPSAAPAGPPSPPPRPGTLVPWSRRPFCLATLAGQACCLGEVVEEAGRLRCSSCSATHGQIAANLAARRRKAAREKGNERTRSRARRARRAEGSEG